MKKMKIAAVALIIASIVLSIVSYLLLPQTVVTQLSFDGNATTMPKLLAIAIPALLGIGCSIAFLVTKNEGKSKNKLLIVSGAGILVFAIMLAVNLSR